MGANGALYSLGEKQRKDANGKLEREIERERNDTAFNI